MRFSTVAAIIAALFSGAKALGDSSASSKGLLCPSLRFGCKNAYRCINDGLMCNGEDDCGDNSDEDVTACILKGQVSAQLACGANEFRCKNGFRCVPRNVLCDDNNDCRDNSDEDPNQCIRAGVYEDNVSCADIGFICGGVTESCISRKLLCNGKNDCGDNSDEDVTKCRAFEELSCEDYEFRCKNEFKCVPKIYLCNHHNDCFDGSDEDPVECAKEGLVPEGTTCADMGFECRNTSFGGSFCIGNLFICDGNDNCGDNSDENPEICNRRSAKPTLEILPWYEPPELNSTVVKICGNDHNNCGSVCMSKKYFCPPMVDCLVFNDETIFICPRRSKTNKCMSHQFKCKNNKCISKSLVCNGNDNCKDMSDEDPIMCNSTVRTTMTTTTVARISQSATSRNRRVICTRYQFKCLDGNKCIQNTFVCDKRPDCADGSDETKEACTRKFVTNAYLTPTPDGPATCMRGWFQCNNKRCILSSFVCDGDNDCQDYTDESPAYCNKSSIRRRGSMTARPPRPMSCLHEEFKCFSLWPTSVCIPHLQVCDGTRNCPLGEDEYFNLCQEWSPPTSTTTRRTNVSCAAREFMCTGGQKCILSIEVCDELHNCDNGSDEDPDICRNSSSERHVESTPGEDTIESTDAGYGATYLAVFSAAALVLIALVVIVVMKKYPCSRRMQPRFWLSKT